MRVRWIVLVIVLLLMSAQYTFADSVPQDYWDDYFWHGGVGSWVQFGSGFGSPVTFDFTSSDPLWLLVTDLGEPGDTFEVWDFDQLLGVTPLGEGAGTYCGNPAGDPGADEAACYAAPYMSHGDFYLSAGTHSLSIVLHEVVEGSGGGAYMFSQADPLPTSPVPEPTTLALIGGGAAVAAIRRKLNK